MNFLSVFAKFLAMASFFYEIGDFSTFFLKKTAENFSML